jgi:hypothetical protein
MLTKAPTPPPLAPWTALAAINHSILFAVAQRMLAMK